MTQILSFNLLTLKLIALWPKDGKISTLYNLIGWLQISPMFFTTSTIIFGIIRATFIESDGYDALIDRLIQLLDVGACIYVRLCFLNKIMVIRQLLRSLYKFQLFSSAEIINDAEEKIQKYSKGDMIFLKYLENNTVYILAFLVYALVGNIIYCVGPLLDTKFCEKNRISNLHRQRDPCGLIARCFYPFDVSGNLFPIAYFLQLLSCIVISSYMVSTTMATIGFMIHIIVQTRNCRNMICNLNGNISKQEMRHIIIYHMQIINCADLINEGLGKMMMVHLTVPSLVISGLGFKILIVYNLSDVIRYALHLFGWIIILLLVCYYGQVLLDESSAIANDIYSCPWLMANVDIRRNIYLVLMRSQRPIVICASYLGPMSLPTFLAVISSAYSYLTLLLNIKS